MRKQLRVEATLAEMDTVMPWQRWVALIKPYYTNRYVFDCETMLRIYCIQQWNNLSDPEMEEALYDRLSYQKFVGLDGFSDPVPDESTILRFRHLLEEHKLSEIIFAETLAYLTELGLVLKRGTIMDATLFEAPVSKKNATGERDPEMSSTNKNNKWHFGAKGHIGVQSEGLPIIHSLSFTTAKVHDSKEKAKLQHGEEKALFGDAAYSNKADKQKCRREGIYYGIADKGQRNKPLSPKQKKKNRKHCGIRAKVEHPFRTLKVLWKHRKLRYKGLAKNAQQFTMLCALQNIFCSRKKILALKVC